MQVQHRVWSLLGVSLSVCLCLGASGCLLDRTGGNGDSGPPAPDSGPEDAGVDAGVDAARPLDAGEEDSGPGDAGTDAGAPDTGCAPAGARCEGGVQTTCLEDGTVTETTCALGCGASECVRPLPSNVAPTDGEPGLSLTLDTDYDTDMCRLGLVGVQAEPHTFGAPVCILRVASLDVPAAATVRVTGSRALVVVSGGPVNIAGVLDASASGDTPGPAGFAGGRDGDTPTRDGQGARPGKRGLLFGDVREANGGAGGGGLCGAGGRGGRVGAFTTPGEGGGTEPANWELSPLIGGSGGGYADGGGTNGGVGGAGGGALQIFSATSIMVSGAIHVDGGGGGGGGNAGGVGENADGGGGGGGSGGSLLLEAPTVELDPEAVLSAAGGGGGGGAGNGAGANGADGRVDPAGRAAGGGAGGARSSDGGDGSAHDAPAGTDGGDLASDLASDDNAGGGGGGAGCILIRNADGSVPSMGTLHPSVAPGLRGLPIARTN